jgi:hypothetical protein
MPLIAPPPSNIVSVKRARIGGAHRKYRLTDDTGRQWLFKPMPRSQVLVDIAAARTLLEAGLLTPIVYGQEAEIRTEAGQEGETVVGSIQPLLSQDEVSAWELPRELDTLSPDQLEDLQRHHVLDWLMANADAHRGQFLIGAEGELIAVDKSQSLRFFPYDALDWEAWAWWTNLRPPVYRRLARLAREGDLFLSREPCVAFAEATGHQPSPQWLEATWRPVFEEWTQIRLLVTTRAWNAHCEVQVQSLLALLAERQARLGEDFEALYDSL